MEKVKFDGESLIRKVLDMNNPKNMSLGGIVRELVSLHSSAQRLFEMDEIFEKVLENKADMEAYKSALENRSKKLYSELDLREKLYMGNYGRSPV